MSTYQNPGVYVSVLNNPVISAVVGNPINICIVGDAPSTQVQTDTFTFKTATSVNTLTNTNVTPTSGYPSLTVVDHYSGASYANNLDYQVGVVSDVNGVQTTTIAPGATTITKSGTVSGGNFTLSFYLNGAATAVCTTATIAYNAANTDVATAISAAFSGSGGIPTLTSLRLSVTVTGTFASGMLIEFINTASTLPQNILTLTANTAGLTGGGTFIPTNTLTGKWIDVTYNYAAPYGNVLNLFNSFPAVQEIYGTPFDSTGAINSPVSLGAYLAFQNGASQLYVMAVKKSGTGAPTAQEWQNAFNLTSGISTPISPLADNGEVDTIVPLVDYSSVNAPNLSFFSTFLNSQATAGTLQRMFLARDTSSTGTQTPSATLQADAQSVSSFRMSILAPTCIQITTSNTANTQQLNVAGFYAAAATAGRYANLPGPQEPLTHKTIAGFYKIPNDYTTQNLLNMQSSGVLCLRQKTNSAQIYVRHGLTTNVSNWLTQEISIIAAQDQLFRLIRTNLENASIIGTAFTQQTGATVISNVTNTLNNAITNNLIQAYNGLQYSIPSQNQTQINVIFQYAPTFPLNYIDVIFSIDPTSGTTTFSSTNNALNTAGA